MPGFMYRLPWPGIAWTAGKQFELFSCGGAPPPPHPLKVGRIRGLRNDGLVHGPWPGPMALAHWSWSMGPGLGPGPALIHGPRPGPWAWPIGPGSGPGPWALAHGPGGVKKQFLLFSCLKQFTLFSWMSFQRFLETLK